MSRRASAAARQTSSPRSSRTSAAAAGVDAAGRPRGARAVTKKVADTVVPAATVADAACQLLKHELKHMAKCLKRCSQRWHRKPEYLHQTRISARRLQQHLALFGELSGKTRQVRWLHKQLRSLLKASSKARDLDVLLHHSAAGDIPAATRRKWQQRRRKLQQPLQKIERRLTRNEALKNCRRALLKAIRTSATRKRSVAVASAPAASWAVEQAAVRLAELQTAIPTVATSKSLHRFRLQVKQYRYQSELLLSLSDNAVIKRLVGCLLQVQKQLGTLQDAVVAARSLKKTGTARKKTTAGNHSDRQAQIAAEATRLHTWLQTKIAPQLTSLGRRLHTATRR